VAARAFQTLDLVVAGTREGVLMVESEASELSEEKMLEAVMFGWKGFQPMIDTIIARSGHSRFTFLISWRFTSSGRSVMSSILLRPSSLRSAPWIAP
jgi:hypothetical protein